MSTTAVLAGSVLPALPFAMLTAVFMAYYTWIAPLPVTGQSVMEYLHLDLYFNDPLWIASHNLFHAPLILLALGGLGWGAMQHRRQWGRALFWFAIGAGLHSFIDIFTHHNDGPLLLFPFNWQIRFPSPISYWHPDHYGLIFAPLEHLLDVALLVYLAVVWVRRRQILIARQRPILAPMRRSSGQIPFPLLVGEIRHFLLRNRQNQIPRLKANRWTPPNI